MTIQRPSELTELEKMAKLIMKVDSLILKLKFPNDTRLRASQVRSVPVLWTPILASSLRLFRGSGLSSLMSLSLSLRYSTYGFLLDMSDYFRCSTRFFSDRYLYRIRKPAPSPPLLLSCQFPRSVLYSAAL